MFFIFYVLYNFRHAQTTMLHIDGVRNHLEQMRPQRDVLFSAALLAYGNTFQKLSLFAKFLKLPLLSVSSFTKIQRTYVIPTIEGIWSRHQNEILENFRGSDVVLLGEYKVI